MSTSLAISAAASVNAAAAQAAATEARKTACQALMPSYADVTATVAARQQYADCVRLLHPSELGAGTVLLWKVAAILFLVLWLAFFVKLQRSGNSTINSVFLGFIVSLTSVTLAGLVAGGVAFLAFA